MNASFSRANTFSYFLKDTRCSYQCGEGKFLSSDTKANSYPCVKRSEHHKYQWGKRDVFCFHD